MTPERWQQIDQLFHDVLERRREDRSAFLDTACSGDPDLRREVDSLLRLEDSAEQFLERPALEHAAVQLARDSPDEFSDPKISGYSIIKLLGEGGMGIVYHAQQTEPIHRRVALKLIKHGMDTRHVIARFEIERQALALMQHPHIASVYDAGSTRDGRPYFVMEYVEGVPVTDYCDQHRLSTRARLELFVDVCAAVQHAHQKGVIHRDIKPSNVLVSDDGGRPFPKIIDFGVAKAVALPLTERTAFTEHGVLVGTPEYMSPEQAALSQDIDTTTDVYSLGVLLYELLVGALPFDPKVLRDAGYDEMRRMIQESEPIKPSARLSNESRSENLSAMARQLDAGRFTRQLKGDLDWITLKALEKDRSRRYQTVAAFAADVTHFLADEPISARAPSAAYRLGKFTRRYRGAVVAAAVVFLTLAGGLAASLYLNEELETQRAEAVHQKSQAVAATTDANRLRAIATNGFETASKAQHEAEYGRFTAKLNAANSELNLYNAAGALGLLMDIPEDQRGWEWHLLYLRTNPSLASLSSRVPCDPPGSIDSPTIISDHVVTVEGERISLRRCATLEIWDRQRKNPEKYIARGKILTVSAKGHFLAVDSTESETDRSWTLFAGDRATRQVPKALGPFSAEPICADFSQDGRRLAVGLMPVVGQTGNDVFEVWDVASARRLHSLAPVGQSHTDTRPRAAPSCLVAFSADSSRLATSGAWVHVWRTDTGDQLAGDPDSAQAGNVAQPVAWDPAGSRLAIGRLTGLVDVLDLTSQPRLDRLDGNGIIQVQPLPAGDRINLVRTRKKNEVLSIAFSRDGTKVATGLDVSVGVWDLSQRKLTRLLIGHHKGVIGVAFDARGQIVSADWGGVVHIWPATPTMSAAINALPGSASPVGDFVLSRNGAVVGIAQNDGGLFAWRLSDLKQTVFRIGSGQVEPLKVARSLAIRPDGKQLFAAEVDSVGTVRSWAVASGGSGSALQLNARLRPDCADVEPGDSYNAVNELAISPNGQWFAFRQGRCVLVVDAATAAVKKALPERSQSFLFLSDSSLLLVTDPPRSRNGGAGPAMKIWNWVEGEVPREVPTPPTRTAAGDAAWRVTASADGRYVALVGGSPTIVAIWDGELKQELGQLAVPPETKQVAFSPDGRRLASTASDTTVRIWDVEQIREQSRDRRQPLLTLTDDDRHRGGLAFTADGRLIMGRASGGLTIWETRKK